MPDPEQVSLATGAQAGAQRLGPLGGGRRAEAARLCSGCRQSRAGVGEPGKAGRGAEGPLGPVPMPPALTAHAHPSPQPLGGALEVGIQP